MQTITDPETIRQIMLRTSTSGLIQIVCGLHFVGTDVIDIDAWNGEKPVRVRLDSRLAIKEALTALNRRIPKEASWDDGFQVEG